MTIAVRKEERVLTREEEAELSVRWQTCRDEVARARLVEAQTGLVHLFAQIYKRRIAGEIVGRHQKMQRVASAYDDLVQEGKLGLLHAADLFDPTRGYRFATLAQFWIKARMRECVLRNFGPVRFGSRRVERTIFSNYWRVRNSLGEHATNADVAEGIGVPLVDLEEALPRIITRDTTIDFGAYDRYNPNEPEHPGATPEDAVLEIDLFMHQRKLAQKALRTLRKRERHIIRARFLEHKTLRELSEHFGVSRERIRQIELRALNKLRKLVVNYST